MEGFLSTLPPYVHSYLERHPPTDVFHCLRELICFAVLYSNDRERIMTKTKQLLDKGADKIDDETKLLAARVYNSKPTGPSGRTSPSSIATVESFGTTELGTPRISATLPLTVPEWLDHSQAAEMPPPSSSAATAETTETNSSVPAPQAPKQRQALEVGRSIIAPSSPEPPASPRTNAKVDPPKADPPKQRRETITSWVPCKSHI
ncbi:hypothetical protein BCR43DRAFT_301174 [Syncephalastrum racemosum]|uniref:Uncharacterized protein n=1 Tax=Syncephalastrum racemosum TaxID=13706 RepID=A0A1X2HB56_SYNRA|nr:hypothetical protein BCR43DRAFT_301174 [Syncephalastrum racemosum]